MSATRDKNQKVAFVYSNIYQLYKNEKRALENEKTLASPLVVNHKVPAVDSGKVLKTGALGVKISEYQPQEFITKRIETREMKNRLVQKPEYLSQPATNPVIDSLRENLGALNELHSKL